MKKEIFELFFTKHTLLIFLALDRENWNYAAKVRHEVSALTGGTMYSYVTKRLKDFEDLGLCESRVSGRKHEYRLTPKGRELQKNFISLVGERVREDFRGEKHEY